MMPEELKTAQREQRDEIAHMQAVGGRIKAAIKRDGRGAEPLEQFIFIRAIGHQAAP